MRPFSTRRRRVLAFTLLELIIVIAIIATLTAVSFPALRDATLRARSLQCAGNLAAIGAAATTAATDNDGYYPEIDQAAAPVYPSGSGVQGLVGTLGPYGITTNSIQCPVDMMSGASSAFATYKSSYEWNPTFDDEITSTPILYWNNGVQVPVNSSRVRLCTDFNSIHNNRMNAVYGDGHVRAR